MSADGDSGVHLDPAVMDGLADVICGDDTSPYYRTGTQIARLFAAAGWYWSGDVDGGRRAWVLEQLSDRRADPAAFQRLLLRIADPREYIDDDAARTAVLADLNRLLALEGYEIYYASEGPRLRSRSRAFNRLDSKAPAELGVDLGLIVEDGPFGAQLAHRLDEARICWDNGAYLAAVIMLGSLLEGVLYDFARTHATTGEHPDDNLQRLITLANQRGWVAADVVDYANVLRDHRNLVHPRKQSRGGHAPDSDSVRIAWNVVVAALNDLAAVGKTLDHGARQAMSACIPWHGRWTRRSRAEDSSRA